MPPHPIQRRLLAEELTRLRRADEQLRYAASQRRGRIDPNPHQIDAVVFALRRIPEGGCILADEVGLGKTIEAGLVIAQLLAEGKRRVLLIVPKPLLGQWQNQLFDLFAIEAREGRADPTALAGPGVFVIGRELAGGDKGSSLLRTAEPFDLCVIDEAHELFAGIYKRFDRQGDYDEDSDEARMAHRVRSVLRARRTPVLLLTATPIQNSLTELWGLVQYVEPTGSLLGKLPTFRELFCDGDDRKLVPGQAHELKRRIGTVVQRTLRRQAQEFLDKPFVDRRARLFEYAMSDEERQLYEDVTAYLLEPELCAFRGNHRRLLLIGFHRRMASSLPALASSLENVAARLRDQLQRAKEAPPQDQTVFAFAADLEDEDLAEEAENPEASSGAAAPLPDRRRIQAELERVEGFIRRIEALPGDSKARCLLEAVRVVLDRETIGEGSGKVVVFTEAITTQDYLARLLVEKGGLRPEDVTVFRGQNEGPRTQEALERWEAEKGQALPPHARPSKNVAVRLALVHEFETRSRVFISTEAGAKGLNLQFCETLINYDLPWNPQRIEQRIGRCHRYGQTRGVTVINFLARENETQRLTFEILSQKLDLFGQVLDASDAVLHRPDTDAPETLVTALGGEFATSLRRIYERARSVKEIEAELRALRESVGERRKTFQDALTRAAGAIETRFDDEVKRVFRRYQEQLPAGLAELDRHLDRLATGYLEALGVATTREGRALRLSADPRLPEGLRGGLLVGSEADPLHLSHPLVQAAVAEARAATGGLQRVLLRPSPQSPFPPVLQPLRGRLGRLAVVKVAYSGFEPVERLLSAAWLEGEAAPASPEVTAALLALEPHDAPPFDRPLPVSPEDLQDALDEALFADQARTTSADQERFERTLAQIERYVEDQELVVRRERAELDAKIAATTAKRDKALGPDLRQRQEEELIKLEARADELDQRLLRLEKREDPDYLEWRADAHRRRYAQPTVTRILDLELSLA